MPNFSEQARGKVRAIIGISYLDARYARGTRGSRILSAFFFIDIDLAGFLPRGVFEHNGEAREKGTHRNDDPGNLGRMSRLSCGRVARAEQGIGHVHVQKKDL